jgi:hypothetical protein
MRLVPFKGPYRVDISLPSPEEGNRSSFRIVFCSYLEFENMYKAYTSIDYEDSIKQLFGNQ